MTDGLTRYEKVWRARDRMQRRRDPAEVRRLNAVRKEFFARMGNAGFTRGRALAELARIRRYGYGSKK